MIAPQSVEEVAAIPIIPLASQVAAAATDMSTSSHLESSLSRVTKSPKAIVAPHVPVTVIQLYFPSALHAGSRATDVFSASVIVPPVVNAEGVVSVGLVSVFPIYNSSFCKE